MSVVGWLIDSSDEIRSKKETETIKYLYMIRFMIRFVAVIKLDFCASHVCIHIHIVYRHINMYLSFLVDLAWLDVHVPHFIVDLASNHFNSHSQFFF